MAEPSVWSAITVKSGCALLVVLLGQFTVGSYYALNVTLVAMKATFNYTQTEVSFVMSSFLLGFGTGVYTGAVLDRIGPKWTSLIGIAMTTPGLGLMYIASVTVDFFRDKSWLIAIFAFVAGQGSFVTFTVTWTTGARQADPRIKGILMGVFKAILLGSPVFFTLIYDVYFKNDQIEDPRKQNFQGYILFVMIMLVSVDVLAICLLKDDNIGTIDANNGQEIEMEIGTYGAIPDVTDRDNLEEDKPMGTTEEVKDELFSSDDEADPKTKYKDFFCSENKGDENEINEDNLSSETVKFNKDTDLLIPVDKDDVPEEHDQKDPAINTCYSFPDSKLTKECEPSENIYRNDADLSNHDDTSSSSSSSTTPSSDNVLSGKENIPLMAHRVWEHVPLLQHLKTASYNAVLWIVALSMATDTIVYSNIPVITQSVNLQYYETSIMITSRVCICSSALCSGIFYNYFNDQRSIYTLMFAAMSVLSLANTMLLISTDQPAILIVAAGLIGVGTGVIWVLGAGLVLTVFGPRDYGRNWGFVIMMAFIVSECMTPIVGKMYDNHVAQSDSHVCYGAQCTREWFILLLCGSLVSLVLCLWQLIISWKKAV